MKGEKEQFPSSRREVFSHTRCGEPMGLCAVGFPGAGSGVFLLPRWEFGLRRAS